jgi:hypothetical protein
LHEKEARKIERTDRRKQVGRESTIGDIREGVHRKH